MAFCVRCGCRLNENSNLCPNCGEPCSQNSNPVSNSFIPKQVAPPPKSNIKEYSSSAVPENVNKEPSDASANSSVSQEQRRQVYDGVIHKCPNCGEVLNGYTANCPSCGYEIRREQAISTIEDLSRKLSDIDKQRKAPSKLDTVREIYGFHTQQDNIYAARASVILTHPIPTTKEDILEFMVLASSNVNVTAMVGATTFDANGNSTRYQKMLVEQNAWLSKMEQAYKKAQLSFPTDPVFQQIQGIYDAKMEELSAAKKRASKSNAVRYIVVAAIVLVLIGIIVLGFKSCSDSLKDIGSGRDEEEKRLESICDDVEENISNRELKSAKKNAAKIEYDGPSSSSLEKKWDETRESYMNRIKELEDEV